MPRSTKKPKWRTVTLWGVWVSPGCWHRVNKGMTVHGVYATTDKERAEDTAWVVGQETKCRVRRLCTVKERA